MMRSQTLNYYSLTVSYDNAFDAIEDLATIGGIHIDDLQYGNPKRLFAPQIQEVTEKLLLLSEIEHLLIDNSLVDGPLVYDNETARRVLDYYKGKNRGYSISESRLVDELKDKHAAIYKMLASKQNMKLQMESIQDTIDALEVISQSLPENHFQEASLHDQAILYEAYIVENKHLLQLQRVIMRVARGHLLCNYASTRDNKKTVVFMVFLASQREYLLEKIRKAMENLGARLVKIPKDAFEFHDYHSWTNRTRLDAIKTLDRTRERIRDLLAWFTEEGDVEGVSRLFESKTLLIKQKELFSKLSYFVKSGEILEGRFWVPKREEERLIAEISSNAARKRYQAFRILKLSVSKYEEIPPTKFTNIPFMANFQEIVNTYGIPRYKEINPGVFTTITFPFLFGVMFGDVGHGGMLWIFGLIISGKPAWFSEGVRAYRHLISLMGFFAFYCGFVYNEFFSLPLIFQDSCYDQQTMHRKVECVYAFGMDHVWHTNKNGISFFNSYKMKLSIVYGVLHMILGILLKGWNNIFFAEVATFVFEFLPQLIFFLATFGYMTFCIIIKWLTNYSALHRDPPSIIGIFINLVSKIDSVLFLNADDQLVLQRLFASIALACVPILFFGKPIAKALYRSCCSRRHVSYRNISENQHIKDLMDESYEDHEEILGSFKIYAVDVNKPAYKMAQKSNEEHGLGEELIHQAIETIEFVLGSVSNTASYLRLWALSLAHNQLAHVFFDMLLRPYLSGKNEIWIDSMCIVVAFVAFFLVTFSVLMCMDVMECFLHALRLHWVEFQNKFYKGDGYAFEDFDMIAIVEKGFR